MAKTVSLHYISDLATAECKNEILLETKLNTELHIIEKIDRTIIKFPFGNKFDIVDGMIIVYEKKK